MSRVTLESTLQEVEASAQVATASAGDLVKVLKKARAAAATGNLSDLEKSITQAQQQLSAIAEKLTGLRASWSFDTQAYFDSGAYSRELLTEIERQELQPAERDGRILTYPSIVRVLASEQAIEVDRKKERRVRPSVVAAELKKRRNRKTGMRPEQMVEVLYRVYEPLVATQKGTRVVRALDMYDLLTQLPHAREYSKQEFARDLLQLDMSTVRATKAGQRVHLRADTAAKSSSVLSAVTPDGEVRIYSGIEFTS